MARKLLVPVLPSDRFLDAVVTAGDRIASEGGLCVFLFAGERPFSLEDDMDGRPSDALAVENADVAADASEVEAWRAAQVAGLDEARQLLYERGLGDEDIDYVFADTEVPAAEAIAEEAAAGGYDAVVLAKGYFGAGPLVGFSSPEAIAAAVREVDGLGLIAG